MSISFLTASQIRKDYRVDKSEYSHLVSDVNNLNDEDISLLEKKIYKTKLNNSHRSKVRKSDENMRFSLYISIRENWVLTPIELSKEDMVICDGLHRLAVAYDIDKDREIPVIYKSFF